MGVMLYDVLSYGRLRSYHLISFFCFKTVFAHMSAGAHGGHKGALRSSELVLDRDGCERPDRSAKSQTLPSTIAGCGLKC